MTAYYPQTADPTGTINYDSVGYGTFDCTVNGGGINSTRHSGGCLSFRTSSAYNIYVPNSYFGSNVTITVSFSTGYITNIS
jgi:hypothetical protein